MAGSKNFGEGHPYHHGVLVYVSIILEMHRLLTVSLSDRSYIPKKSTNWGLPPKTAFFVERTSLMESMHNALFSQCPNAQRIMVLWDGWHWQDPNGFEIPRGAL
jgi:hypothetical protein